MQKLAAIARSHHHRCRHSRPTVKDPPTYFDKTAWTERSGATRQHTHGGSIYWFLLRKAITSALSVGFLKPTKAMFVPGCQIGGRRLSRRADLSRQRGGHWAGPAHVPPPRHGAAPLITDLGLESQLNIVSLSQVMPLVFIPLVYFCPGLCDTTGTLVLGARQASVRGAGEAHLPSHLSHDPVQVWPLHIRACAHSDASGGR